ncbi:cytochrome P450, partial [bacterium]|nr:cytochrome P450 [bacterium]
MTLETELTVDTINLFDETLFEYGLAHEAFRILRREDPIHWSPPTEEVVGVWNLVKYNDIRHVSRHPELFGSEEGIIQYRPINDEDMAAAATGNGKMLITMDPPRHVKLRRLVNKGFTPRAVRGMHDQIVAITKELLDGIAKKGECDFVIDVASTLPLAVICGMLGLERKDWDLMFQLTNKVLGPGDPEYQTDVPEDQRGTPEAARITGNMGTFQMFGFFGQILQAARSGERPLGEDLISILVSSDVDGEKLTDDDILWFCFLLILAGNETTR